MRYLATLALAGLLSFAAVWFWVATMPITFMDAEFPSWAAKMTMLDRCDLGDVLILGDSRAAAGILPLKLGVRTTNLAVGGGEATEAFAALQRALACPNPPKEVIISLDPGHFALHDMFWERSVRYGFISGADLVDLRRTSRMIGDPSLYSLGAAAEVPPWLRDWMYRVHFPPLYFSSLLHGGGILRWGRNRRTLAHTLSERGHYYFGTSPGSDTVAIDGHMASFRPLPILDCYFDRMLAVLDQRGIETRFIAMPVNEATWKQVRPAMLAQFTAYLGAYERRYSHFHADVDLMPHWPDRFFGDEFCHLNPPGAEKFSAELDQRLQDAPPSTQKEAQNGWLRGTGADASTSVVPISKRGS
jgi:hypothetical protein